MSWMPNAYVAVVFLGALVSLGVSVTAARRRHDDSLATAFAILMGAVGIWALSAAVGYGYTDVERMYRWKRLSYVGAVVAPPAWFVFAARYANLREHLTQRTYVLLSIVPATTLIAVWTNSYHQLVWRDLGATQFDDVGMLEQTFGPWYWVNVGYSYLLVTAGILLLVRVLFVTGPLYRKQVSVLLVGVLVPLGANVGFNIGGSSVPVDLTTVSFAVSGTVFALALYHFDLLEFRPLVRDALIARLSDGFVVVDGNGQVIDFNDVANDILDGELTIGADSETALPKELLTDGGTLHATVGGRSRAYQVRTGAVNDTLGHTAGRLFYFTDVTEIFDREQRLGVLNRVLRHNVRNDIGVVLGYVDAMGEQLPQKERYLADRASRAAERILSFSETAREIERAAGSAEVSVTVSLESVVERVVERYREEYPEARIVVGDVSDVADVEDVASVADVEDVASVAGVEDVGDVADVKALEAMDATARVVDEGLLVSALSNAVENAIVHSDRETPQVWIRVNGGNDRVRLSVADDGPGIPESERAALAATEETPLQHGSGLGLWLIRWTVTLSKGTITLRDRKPRGSVIELEFQRAETPDTELTRNRLSG